MSTTALSETAGATVVITHRVKDGQEPAYEAWLAEIAPLCQAWPGYLDTALVRPVPGLTHTYTLVIRFDSPEHLRGWMSSPERTQMIARAEPLLAEGDRYVLHEGLDFLFADAAASSPPAAGAKPAAPPAAPVRWKQFLITWSVIFPLVLTVPQLVLWLFTRLGLPTPHVLIVLLSTACIVYLTVYWIMPRYTRLVRRWLFS